MSEPGAGTLLLVDDDERYRERLARALRDRGLVVFTAPGGEQAVALAKAHAPGRAVVDLRMPTGSGLDVIEQLRAVCPDLAVVMLTGYGSIATAVDATKRGAVHYLQKPVDADQLLAAFGDAPPPATDPTKVPSLDRVEYEHIQRVLHDCGGNISEAARRLGLHRRSLQRKLQRTPIPQD